MTSLDFETLLTYTIVFILTSFGSSVNGYNYTLINEAQIELLGTLNSDANFSSKEQLEIECFLKYIKISNETNSFITYLNGDLDTTASANFEQIKLQLKFLWDSKIYPCVTERKFDVESRNIISDIWKPIRNTFKNVLRFVYYGFKVFAKIFTAAIRGNLYNLDYCKICNEGFRAIQAAIKLQYVPLINLKLKTMESDGMIGPAITVMRMAKDIPIKAMCDYLMCGKYVGDLPNIKDVTPNASLHFTSNDSRESYYKVLHLADIHIDPLYEENQDVKCNGIICCRKFTTLPRFGSSRYWGTRTQKCDIPQRLVENAMRSIANAHKNIDYIIWTGDVVPHDFQGQNSSTSSHMLELTNKLFTSYFPNYTMFSSLGNHEGIPINNFAPPEVFGCTQKWIIFKQVDPANELQWLFDTLTNSEKHNEKVHIIGHIPPGSNDCVATWSRIYFKIIKRFSKTVTAQFFGHTHLDEFQVFQENGVPFSIAYIAPSLTTYDNVNPAYRIYHVDKTTKTVTNHETWTTDLNYYHGENDPPQWFRLYNAKQQYGLDDLSPPSWNELIEKMQQNNTLFQEFYKLHYRHDDIPECEGNCKFSKLCSLKSGKSFSDQLCLNKQVINIYNYIMSQK